jgi:hypothetical protein
MKTMLTAGCAVVALSAGAARAQEAPGTVQEIVVTAQEAV